MNCSLAIRLARAAAVDSAAKQLAHVVDILGREAHIDDTEHAGEFVMNAWRSANTKRSLSVLRVIAGQRTQPRIRWGAQAAALGASNPSGSGTTAVVAAAIGT